MLNFYQTFVQSVIQCLGQLVTLRRGGTWGRGSTCPLYMYLEYANVLVICFDRTTVPVPATAVAIDAEEDAGLNGGSHCDHCPAATSAVWTLDRTNSFYSYSTENIGLHLGRDGQPQGQRYGRSAVEQWNLSIQDTMG